MIVSLGQEELKDILEKKDFQRRIDELARKYAGKKIIVYGAGMMFSLIQENYDTSKLNIIGVADKKLTTMDDKFKGFQAMSPYDIPDFNPDAVLIAIYVTSPIIRFLKEDVLLPSDKIIVEPFIKKSFKEKLEEFLNNFNSFLNEG